MSLWITWPSRGKWGGFLLPTPKVWLHAQFGLPFHKLLQTPDVFTMKLVTGFYSWCKTYGVCLNAWALPYLQMGPVPYKTFGFMQYNFKSFSISRRYVIDGLGDHDMVGELPLWHSAIFQNDKRLTYFCLALMRQEVTQVKHMFVNGLPRTDLLGKLGTTWQQVYHNGLNAFLKVQPTDWSKPSVWLAAWGSRIPWPGSQQTHTQKHDSLRMCGANFGERSSSRLFTTLSIKHYGKSCAWRSD